MKLPAQNDAEKKDYRKSHLRQFGGWASSRGSPSADASHHEEDIESHQEQIATKYKDFPLVKDILLHEKERRKHLEDDGCKQMFYPKSSDGWLRSLCVIEGRALDQFFLPWLLVSLNAIAYTIFAELYIDDNRELNLLSFESFVGIILSSALSFLLVFRLNRSAERFWQARMAWGIIIASSRSIVGGLIAHGAHDPTRRDEVIRLTLAFAVALTHFMRNLPQDPGTFLGIFSTDMVEELDSAAHPPLLIAERIRGNLSKIFSIDENTSVGIAHGRSQRLSHLENELDILILQMGAIERIQATPLPLVYVTHLRTFLLCFLIAMPYVWQGSLGYGTIPFVMIASYALLGLEGNSALMTDSGCTNLTPLPTLPYFMLFRSGDGVRVSVRKGAPQSLEHGRILPYHSSRRPTTYSHKCRLGNQFQTSANRMISSNPLCKAYSSLHAHLYEATLIGIRSSSQSSNATEPEVMAVVFRSRVERMAKQALRFSASISNSI